MIIKNFSDLIEEEVISFFVGISKLDSYKEDFPSREIFNMFVRFHDHDILQNLHNKVLEIIGDDIKRSKMFFVNSKSTFIHKYELDYNLQTFEDKILRAIHGDYEEYLLIFDRDTNTISRYAQSINDKLPKYWEFLNTLSDTYNQEFFELNKSLKTNAHYKLKVNLSVKELAALFRLLDEVQPKLFDYTNKTDLYRFIASNFITKGTVNKSISEHSLKNDFIDLDIDSTHVWDSYMDKMKAFSKTYRNK